MANTTIPASPHVINVATALTGKTVMKLYRAEIELQGDDYTEELTGDAFAYVLAPNAQAAVDQVASALTDTIEQGLLEAGRWIIAITPTKVNDYGIVVFRNKRAEVTRVIGEEQPVDLTDIDNDDEDEDTDE